MNERAPRGHSAGAQLRAARERQGLHIAALAAAIKVTQRKLEALEADRYDELPDATFTRALAQTVCRTLKIDAAPVLAELPQLPSLALDLKGGRINTPFRERPGREDPGLRISAVRPLVWAGALLALGAVVLYGWPAGYGLSLLQRVRPAVAAAPASAPEPVMPSAPSASEPVMAMEPAASAPGLAAQPAAGDTTSPVAAAVAPPTPVPAAAPPGAAPVAAGSGLVQVRSMSSSWVQARDAKGQVLLSRTVVAGEAVGLDGALPIRLTIGNANAAQLNFRGQPVDLKPSTRDNVARLELQ